MGIKLNKQRKTLKNTPYQSKDKINLLLPLFVLYTITKKIKNKIAKIKFESGPENETRVSSFKTFLKLFLFIGTGLAQPIRANPETNEANGKIIVPTRSICLSGFNEYLPSFFAVSSPSL